MDRVLRSTKFTGPHEAKVRKERLVRLRSHSQHIVLINNVDDRSYADDATGRDRLNSGFDCVNSVLGKQVRPILK